MLESVQNIFKIPELRKRVIFTLLILFVERIGTHVPVPGINSRVLLEFFSSNQGGGLLGL